MIGRYPIGAGYFGRAPSTSALVYVFGQFCATGLASLSALHRVTGLDGPRALAATSPLRSLLFRGARYALAGRTTHRMECP